MLPLSAENISKVDQKTKTCDFLTRLLAEEIANDISEYQNLTDSKKLIIEAKTRYKLFTYWIYVEKFNIEKSEILEIYFGKFAKKIKDNGGYDRTFVLPNFIASADHFPKHGYKSPYGDQFKIESPEQFKIENTKFLEFLEKCIQKSIR